MFHIPIDIVHDILISVPPDSLARFRSVCKTWKQMIDESDFTKLNLINQMGGDNILITNINDDNESIGNLFSISLTSLYRNENDCEIKPVKGLPSLCNFPVASCNGLVLVGKDDTLRLWNHLTGEYCNVPSHCSVYKGRKSASVGLGFDSAGDDYKIVKLFGSLKTVIYSLKTDKWHRIGNYPNSAWLAPNRSGVFVSGAIHWIACVEKRGSGKEMIIALDLSTEKYREIAFPSEYQAGSRSYLNVVLNDRLVFTCGFDAWILDDYGGEDIWTNFLSLEKVHISFTNQTRLLAYIKGNEQVLIQNKCKQLFWYYLQTKSVKEVNTKGLQSGFSCQVVPASLIRINGGNMEGTLNRSTKRLKLELTTSDVLGSTREPGSLRRG